MVETATAELPTLAAGQAALTVKNTGNGQKMEDRDKVLKEDYLAED